jgi:hypothetical protein
MSGVRKNIQSRLLHLKRQMASNSLLKPITRASIQTRIAYMYSEIRSSGYFDPAWYRLAYHNEIEFSDDLLKDYILAGIQNKRDPSPYFNTILYRRQHDVPCEKALIHFLHSRRKVASGAYRNEQALLDMQQAFYSQSKMALIEDRRASTKPYAVFLQCGADSTWAGWQPNPSRAWHLFINHYDATYAGKIPCDVELHQVGKNPGTKFTAFHSLLENYHHLIEPYEYILLMDDDVVLENGTISQLFTIVQQHGWEMAQASLSPDSFCSFPAFFNPGKQGWRQVNGVEIMMPVYSTRILGLIRQLVGQSISGWGFDAALSMMAAKHGYRAAVVDDVVARHDKRTNADIGAFYQMLHRENIYPEIEFTHLQKKYGFTKPLFYEI